MAATRIMSIHINKGKTARQCIGERLDYIMNPKKTDGGILVSTYACSPETVADEFMLFRQEYQANTGRTQENEVIGYHVRQAFKPEEITPEEANEIGKELASRMTDDQFAYVVATHIDKHHVHNHIVICSTALDCQHKYRDVKRSGKDLAQLSDEICEEHQLSVIRDPQNKTVSLQFHSYTVSAFPNLIIPLLSFLLSIFCLNFIIITIIFLFFTYFLLLLSKINIKSHIQHNSHHRRYRRRKTNLR